MGKIFLLCDDSLVDSPVVQTLTDQFEAVRMPVEAKSVVSAVKSEVTDLIAVYANDFTSGAEREFNRIAMSVKGIPFVFIGSKEICRSLGKSEQLEIAANIFTPVSIKDFTARFNSAVCSVRGLPEPVAEEDSSDKKEEETPLKHILVADDDNIFLRTINNWLHYDYKVSVVKSGQGVMQHLEKKP